MEAVKSDILTILGEHNQFVVPVYQRNYSWGIAQCKRLWNDIDRLQRTGRPGHFVGSFVNIQEKSITKGYKRYMIIDGQQRMATLTLLLVALRDYLSGHPDKNLPAPDELHSKYLCAPGNKNSFKLLLTKTDQPVLQSLLDGKRPDRRMASRVLDTYYFFWERLENGTDCKALFDAIQRLQIVNITLDRQEDDAQMIFESLNSTGLELSHSDLIRNYVLMGLDNEKQEALYAKVWHPMENLFEYEKQPHMMDRFFRDFITMKLGRIPKVDRVYSEFKSLYDMRENDPVRLSKELARYAGFYTNLYYCQSKNGEWDEYFHNIKALQMEVSYPFLLRAYADCEDGKLEKKEFAQILQLCENYVFRRSICGIPTNSLNKTFATIKNEIDEKEYLRSVKAYFLTRDSYKEFPSDERFVMAFKAKDVYNMRIRGYILHKLENAGREVQIDTDTLTVEHILPANPNLSLEWRRMVGSEWRQVQRTWLNTIGNVTLAEYAEDMADRPFAEKLKADGGLANGSLQLNETVKVRHTWTEKAIIDRGEKLARQAVKVWPAPVLTPDELKPYQFRERIESYSPESYDFNAFTKILFEHLDQQVQDISPAIKRECKKQSVLYIYDTIFLQVNVQKTHLRLTINLLYDEVDDPQRLCREVLDSRRQKYGDVEILFESLEQLNAVVNIVRQAYRKQAEL